MENETYATLRCDGKYTTFSYDNGKRIVFMHGKDLVRYLRVKVWDNGYIVVDCEGKAKGEYEDYIDLQHLMENLYMEPERQLRGIKGVRIENGK
ncbi:MAG: hypothetical protein K6F53_04485 [Lachnospiraceae bacterium]|nr:hypothetical protein [Lachnospiraceae bacterium]